MSTLNALREIWSEARPLIEREMNTRRALNALLMAAWRDGCLDKAWAELRTVFPSLYLTYFVRARGMGDIKIGKSNQVEVRVRNLWSGASRGVDLIACYPAPIDHEVELHREFEQYRLCGEWFRPGLELLTHLELVGCDINAFTNEVPAHFYRRFPHRLAADVNTAHTFKNRED